MNMLATPTTTPSICLDEGTTTEGDLNSIHLKFCKLQVWGRYVNAPKFFLNPYLVFELVLVLASCSLIYIYIYIYIYNSKKLRGIAMAATLKSSSTKYYGKYSQYPAFDTKQSPVGRSLEDH